MLYQGISVSKGGHEQSKNGRKAYKSLVERVSGMVGFEIPGKFL